jgi:hypothetical protein
MIRNGAVKRKRKESREIEKYEGKEIKDHMMRLTVSGLATWP